MKDYQIKIKILIIEGSGKWERRKETLFIRSAETLEGAHSKIREFQEKYSDRFISARIFERKLIETI